MTKLYVPPAGRAPVGDFGTLQAGTLIVGDYPTNYFQVDENGHWTLHGNARAWDDLIRPAIAAQLNSPAGWTAVGPGTLFFTYPGAGNFAQMSEFAEISGAAITTVSSFFDVKLYRDTTNVSGLFAGADPLVGDAALKEFDPHLLFDALGSDQEYVK